jgi:pilus assembly protein Flp/PilA
MRAILARAAKFTDSVKPDRGATAVEYALIVGGIALVVIVAIGAIGGTLGDLFTAIGSKLTEVMPK